MWERQDHRFPPNVKANSRASEAWPPPSRAGRRLAAGGRAGEDGQREGTGSSSASSSALRFYKSQFRTESSDESQVSCLLADLPFS